MIMPSLTLCRYESRERHRDQMGFACSRCILHEIGLKDHGYWTIRGGKDTFYGVRRQSRAATALWLGAAKTAPYRGSGMFAPIQSGVARGNAVPSTIPLWFIMECGGKRSATPLWLLPKNAGTGKCGFESILTQYGGKAPSPRGTVVPRSAGALQKDQGADLGILFRVFCFSSTKKRRIFI